MPIKTASSWDSFRSTLIAVLGAFHPKTVLEYGPGVSTLIMQDFPSVESITTIEHDVAWFHKWQSQVGGKVNLILEEDLEIYPDHCRGKEYDLYFVDGREREICLLLCNRPTGIVILHDAERPSYKPYIDKFKYVFMEDDGHTCVMTNDDETGKKLESVFLW